MGLWRNDMKIHFNKLPDKLVEGIGELAEMLDIQMIEGEGI